MVVIYATEVLTIRTKPLSTTRMSFKTTLSMQVYTIGIRYPFPITMLVYNGRNEHCNIMSCFSPSLFTVVPNIVEKAKNTV